MKKLILTALLGLSPALANRAMAASDPIDLPLDKSPARSSSASAGTDPLDSTETPGEKMQDALDSQCEQFLTPTEQRRWASALLRDRKFIQDAFKKYGGQYQKDIISDLTYKSKAGCPAENGTETDDDNVQN